MYFFLWTHFRLSNWIAIECYSVGGWEWCESLSSQLEYSRAGHSKLYYVICPMLVKLDGHCKLGLKNAKGH